MKRFLVAMCVAFLATVSVFAETWNLEWVEITDIANKGNSSCRVQKADETIGNTKCKNVVTMFGQVTTLYKYGFIGMMSNSLSAENTVNGKQASFLQALTNGRGIRFKTTGDGKKYDVRVETKDCTDYCFYCVTFTAPKGGAITEVEIPYTALKQYSWGAPKPFVKSNITNVSFQTVGQPIPSVNLKIWDFEVLY